jgi:transcriptional regulator with XRE-family HTH domain
MNEVNDEQSVRTFHEARPIHDLESTPVPEPGPIEISLPAAPCTQPLSRAAGSDERERPLEEAFPFSPQPGFESLPVRDHEAMLASRFPFDSSSSSSPGSTNILVDDEQQKNGAKKRDSTSMVGRKRKASPTVHGWRLHWLIWQLKREGLAEAEIARRAGLGQTYINAYARIEETGVSGVSLDVAQKLCDALGMDGRYWLDRYKGERPYKLYLFDAEKQRIENERLETKLQEMTTAAARSDERIDRLEQVIAELSSPVRKARPLSRITPKDPRKMR